MKRLPLEMVTILRWHLGGNVFPYLTEHTIDCIIQCCEQYLNGKIDLETPVGNGQFTFGEMIDDLRIDLSLFSNPQFNHESHPRVRIKNPT